MTTGLLRLAAARRSVADWTPANLGSLVAWYDASDAATITAVNGFVSQWNDKSGNGHHVTQATETYKPVTGTRTQNGLNVLDFTPNDQLYRDGPVLPSPITVAGVAKFDAIRSDGSVIVALAHTASYGVAALSSFDPDGWWLKGTINVRGSGTGGPDMVAAFQYTAVLDGAASLLRVNRTQRISGDAGTTTGNRIHISGHGPHPSGYGIDGYIAEIVIVNSVPSGDDLTNLENYLMDKWGIA